MRFVKIEYADDGFVRIQPDYISHVRYFTQGQVVFYLKNDKEILVDNCSLDDAKRYIKDWREALEENNGYTGNIGILPPLKLEENNSYTGNIGILPPLKLEDTDTSIYEDKVKKELGWD